MSPNDIIMLKRYPDEFLAEMARATLEAHDIPAIVSRDDCGGMEPYLHAVFGARLLIHHGNAVRALEILDNPDQRFQFEGDDPVEDVGA